MKLALWSLLVIVLAGCVSQDRPQLYMAERPPTPEKVRLVDEISKDVCLQLHKQNRHLYPIVISGSMMDEVKFLQWGFHYYGKMEIEEARALLVSAGKQFLKAFNEDERIRPYLAFHPFTPKKIQIDIYLYNSDGSEVPLDALSLVSIQEGGTLEYRLYNSKNRFEIVLAETFEEGEAILMQSCAPTSIILPSLDP